MDSLLPLSLFLVLKELQKEYGYLALHIFDKEGQYSGQR